MPAARLSPALLLVLISPAFAADAPRRADTPAARLNSAISFLDSPDVRTRLTAFIRDHYSKAAAARDFAMDRRRYPEPKNAIGWNPGVDVQPGQAELERLTADAIDAHNALEAELLRVTAAAELIPALPTDVPLPKQFGPQTAPPGFDPARLPHGDRTYIASPKTRPPFDGKVLLPPPATRLDLRPNEPVPILVYTIIDPAPAWDRYLRGIADGVAAHNATAGGKPLSPVLRALAAVAGHDSAALDALRPALTPLDQWWVNHLAAYAVFAYNAPRPDVGPNHGPDDPTHTPAELEALDLLNNYRLAMGLLPLVVDDRLQLSARAHSAYQTRRNAIAHLEDDPKMRHAWDRAKSAGYPNDNISEDISAGMNSWAVWGWRTDAAHHRVLLTPDKRAIGLGIDGKFVTAVLAGRDDSPLAPMLRPEKPLDR